VRRQGGKEEKMSDHILPRIISEIEVAQEKLALDTIRSSSPEKFLENRGVFFGLERALEIIRSTINSERE
jgi:hypothetical protein